MPKSSKRMEQRRKRRLYRTLMALGALGAVAVVATALIILAPPAATVPPNPVPQGQAFAKIITSSGCIVFQIYQQEVPNTSAHFIGLFQSGYYNGLIWHRVENWVIQTGQGTQQGTIALEINSTLHNDRGVVGVARTSDPNSGSTQFYILKSANRGLDGQYAIFGQVVTGLDVVDRVVLNETISTATFQQTGAC